MKMSAFGLGVGSKGTSFGRNATWWLANSGQLGPAEAASGMRHAAGCVAELGERGRNGTLSRNDAKRATGKQGRTRVSTSTGLAGK